MTTANLHFSIEADFILRHARDMVLSNDWRGALRLLTEGLEGMSHELACSILKGERMLVDVDGGILDEPQDPGCPHLKRYLSTFAWQQAGVCRLKHGYYRPYAVIPAFGAAARAWAMEQLRAGDESVSANRFRALCARWYMVSRHSDLVYFEPDNTAVLFERVEEPPVWVEAPRDQAAALAAFRAARTLEVCEAEEGASSRAVDWLYFEPAVAAGHVYFSSSDDTFLPQPDREALELLTERADAVLTAKMARDEDAQQQAEDRYEQAVLSTRVRQQAEKCGGYLQLEVEDPHKGKYMLAVPYAPFMHWATRDAGRIAKDSLPAWEPVCTSGMKMMGDNPIHTDWWLGSGQDLQGAYDHDSPVNKAAWRFSVGLSMRLGHDCLRLAGRGKVFGQVVFPKANEAVPEGSIAVVPHAGVDYEIAMLSACKAGRGAVISAVGGKLAHLATVARETSCRVLVVDDAMSVFQEGDFVSIDLDELKVQRHQTLLNGGDLRL